MFIAGAVVTCSASPTVKNALAPAADRAKGKALRSYGTVVNYTCNQGWVGGGSMECKVRLPASWPAHQAVVMMDSAPKLHGHGCLNMSLYRPPGTPNAE